MKLYFSPGACSLAPHIVLTESGLKFSLERVDLATGQFKGGDYSKINPKGYVPTLELDNGEILTEAAVIIQFIADLAPTTNLIPKQGTMERYRCQEWLNYIATEVHKGFGPLWDDTTPASVVTATKQNLENKFDFLSHNLEGKAYLMGQQFTVADAYLFTILNWSFFLKLDLSRLSTLTDYISRIKARPATIETLKSEGLLK